MAGSLFLSFCPLGCDGPGCLALVDICLLVGVALVLQGRHGGCSDPELWCFLPHFRAIACVKAWLVLPLESVAWGHKTDLPNVSILTMLHMTIDSTCDLPSLVLKLAKTDDQQLWTDYLMNTRAREALARIPEVSEEIHILTATKLLRTEERTARRLL